MFKPLFPLLIAVTAFTASYGQKREEPLETQIDLLEKIGEAKYGQLNADSADSAE